ncbi:hypothetical protein NBRC10512_003066 [Rhodotorula toruloides]|uniref:1-acyl-sn-glycerol-3-phosphate acyltransferase n=2 Tax=Rhodotorula toruloides TaxID=5286 RepID=A0A061ATV1_RHOTO|nr:1-acylglycerol-3-phosphate acyltransferase [Rhodotorula toruloides NP11]EMS23659.1 1-acylglycerol-3-phosphate acyltransferase [Rhodotorula toruloides NP11]CDR41045.1 RHTO0S05e11122g1_1 [Rhodotorula toruloides]
MPSPLSRWLPVIAFWTFPLLAMLSVSPSLRTFLLSRPTLTYALASVLPTIMLSRFVAPIRYYLRLTTFLVGLAANAMFGAIMALPMSLVGKGKDNQWLVARSFVNTVAPLVGVKFRVEGRENLDKANPAVLVGNHQTMVDILYLGAVFPKGTSVMAKRELQWTPILGQWMTLSKAVFVNRAKREDAVKVFAKVAAKMKKNSLSLWIFAEGTRSASPTPSLLPFKKGAFHLAVQAGLPVVPIVCENYAHVYHAKARRFNDGEIVVRVLEPISTEGYTSSSADIAHLTELTRDRMLEAIEDLGRKRQEQLRLAGHGQGQGQGEREALLAGRESTSGETASARIEAPSE